MAYTWLQQLATITIDPGTVGVPEIPLDNTALANILSAVFLVIGGLAVLFLLIGAVRYVTSNGDSGSLKTAKDTILYSIIGVVVSLSAFLIVQFVIGSLSGTI